MAISRSNNKNRNNVENTTVVMSKDGGPAIVVTAVEDFDRRKARDRPNDPSGDRKEER